MHIMSLFVSELSLGARIVCRYHDLSFGAYNVVVQLRILCQCARLVDFALKTDAENSSYLCERARLQIMGGTSRFVKVYLYMIHWMCAVCRKILFKLSKDISTTRNLHKYRQLIANCDEQLLQKASKNCRKFRYWKLQKESYEKLLKVTDIHWQFEKEKEKEKTFIGSCKLFIDLRRVSCRTQFNCYRKWRTIAESSVLESCRKKVNDT